ncbi:3-oxoacyl-[acyl-carrier-protein] reductase [bacterium]|nr:3-oxoacyl-[acyl-carrier-protein] reductase [bacterium]MBU1937937.1 3-oxoacyl-[acyl-carrier-protein] reductase [bacterium]
MTRSLEGKVAWVTGSARGIGKAIARALAEQGASVAVTDIEGDIAKTTSAELAKDFEVKSIAAPLDVTDAAGIESFIKQIQTELGVLHILVNNAGITRDGLLIRMSEDDWDRVLQVNLKGTFLCTREAAKVMMRARSGKIINIASVVGMTGNAGQANYASSKAGVIGLTKSTAKELAARGIRVNAVAPGYIATEMTKGLPENAKTEFLKGIPLGTVGQPEDVARVVIFLASPASDYITGQVIRVDGGMQM